jgi:uncharacterized repeat protein (TIGR01451 family)
MKLVKQGLEQGGWLLVAIAIPWLLSSQIGSKATAQTVTITNKGNANFQDTVGGTVQNVESNQTLVNAVVVAATIEVIKTADKAAAEPGDTVVYRLQVRNTGQANVRDLEVQDTLPLGLNFQAKSIQAVLTEGNQSTPVELPNPDISNRTVTFRIPINLGPRQSLNIVYAVTLTPDAIRGNGRNVAEVIGTSRGRNIRSNVASHRVQIRPGIVSDCGTLIGRVFVDKNFDGEQQPGEPGVPNAVIFLDDGNRITTDANGLFSVANVIAGNRTGTLDLSSLPGYTLAPNLYFIERNSQSRLVRLEPGGTVRMNFGVTPAFGEERSDN